MDPGTTAPNRIQAAELIRRAYLLRIAEGTRMKLELYPDKAVSLDVESCAVLRMRRGLYRAVLMIDRKADDLPHIRGFESSKIAVAHWLRGNGVPVLRIGSEEIPSDGPIPFHLPTEN